MNKPYSKQAQPLQLWCILVMLLVLGVFSFAPGNHGPARFASAATQPPISGLDTLRQGVPLQKDNPAASIDAFLRSAGAARLDANLKKRIAFFGSLLKTPLPNLDGDDLRLVLKDATNLNGNKIDVLPVLANGQENGEDRYIVAGIDGGWLKYAPIQSYTIRFIKNVQLVTFYLVYESKIQAGQFLPVIRDIPPVRDAKGFINYSLRDGTLIAQYGGKFVKEISTGFLLNIAQDVGEYVEIVKAAGKQPEKQIYHYGWQAYPMATEKTGTRWRVLPTPAIDDINFFKTKLGKVLTDNLPAIQKAYSLIPADERGDFVWTKENIDKAIADYRFPGAGAARPVLLDSGTVDISAAFFAQERPKIAFGEGSLSIATKYAQEKDQQIFTQEQVQTAILYPFEYPDELSLYDRFRFASALTVASSGRYVPIVINILRPEDLPTDAQAVVRSDGLFRMNAAFVVDYVFLPGTATGLLSHELGGHYIEAYEEKTQGLSLRPALDGSLVSDPLYNTVEPFNYLRGIRDDAELILNKKIDPANLNFELYLTSSFVPLVRSTFGASSP